jgi:hypothetical protein
MTYVFFTAGSDYDGTVAPQVFIFSSDVSIITFRLPLIDDSIFETSENLTAHLSFPGPMLPPRASIVPDTADIIIVDEDSKYFSSVRNCWHFICFFMHLLPALDFSFDPDEYNSSESEMDETVQLSVSLIGDLGEFTIQVATATDDSSTEATATGNYRHERSVPATVSCA